jgi:hypothetical protein
MFMHGKRPLSRNGVRRHGRQLAIPTQGLEFFSQQYGDFEVCVLERNNEPLGYFLLRHNEPTVCRNAVMQDRLSEGTLERGSGIAGAKLLRFGNLANVIEPVLPGLPEKGLTGIVT